MDTVLPTIGRLIWRWVELQGLCPETLFAQQGLGGSDLQSVRNRIASHKLDLVVAEAIDKIKDDCCGLRLARCWHPSDLGALGYAWLASSSIRTAVQRMARYSRIVGDSVSVVEADCPTGLRVVVLQKTRDPELRKIGADFVMSLMVDMSRFNAGASLMPHEVTLRRERPECADSYVDFYGCDVHFAADEDAFILSADDVDRMLPTSNKQLAGLHDQVLAQQLASSDQQNVSARCKAILMENLTSGDIAAEQVAGQLHMSPRTLSRRLEDQGTSVKALVDEVRSELAARYLVDPNNSITEVAFLLGFSHPSSLSRAATRWFGMSPIEYRSTQSGLPLSPT